MVAVLYVDRRPPGCWDGTAREYWGASGVSIQGAIPPGLTPPFEDDDHIIHTRFEGTPTQPGEWLLSVTFHRVRCLRTGEVVGDRSVEVRFRIEGDAVPGLKE